MSTCLGLTTPVLSVCAYGHPIPLRLSGVVKWFDRTPREALAPLLRPRKQRVEGNRVLLQDLRPEPLVFLGQAAALQLAVLQQASQAVRDAPSLESKAQLADVTRIVADRYSALSSLIESEGEDSERAMQPFLAESERFTRATSGADWYELLLSLHVTSGLLIDFFVAYAGSLPETYRGPVLRALQRETGQPILAALLKATIDGNPRLASRLALWGRRLVGDTLLQMYIAVNGGDQATVADAAPGEGMLEPAFNDLVALHSIRMDALGLTA